MNEPTDTPVPQTMENQRTTEEMRDALEAAGKRIKRSATDEEVAMAHLELEAELEAAGKIPMTAAPVETSNEPETISDEPVGQDGETINDVIERVRDKVMSENVRDYAGDKEPEVIAWARKNLTSEEVEARYAGRLK